MELAVNGTYLKQKIAPNRNFFNFKQKRTKYETSFSTAAS